LERDNRGLGVDDPTATGQVALKSIFLVDLAGATNVAGISLAGSNVLPSGVNPVSKTLFLDIRAALIAAGAPIAEKIEGFAFGPYLAGNGISLILGSDNDFSVTQNASGTQLDVCTSGVGGTSSQVALGTACPTGQALLPNYFYSFALSAAETRALGLAPVPEPQTWGLMLLGLGAIASELRRKRIALRT
jgi:Esterase-like activity of phytase/PEP-CTERM motif